ncbi:HIT family protein [Candidatus Woesearchaeota archaeon]|nr:HIT family protein [Candidatus Woesearchaeota archaeon]
MVDQMGSGDCIFCQLASGAMDSKVVYEDDDFKAILDIYPASPGHVLVIPKEHVVLFNQLSEYKTQRLGVVAKIVSEKLFKALKPHGLNVFIANGTVAGQKAPHMICHVIPRFEGDGLNFNLPEGTEVDEESFSKIKEFSVNAWGEAKPVETQAPITVSESEVTAPVVQESIDAFDDGKVSLEAINKLYEESDNV